MATFPVFLESSTYQKLQQLAVLAGSESAAVERLIAHWQSTSALSPRPSSAETPSVAFWRSTAGDVLPVGQKLEAVDGGKIHYASVERTGLRYGTKLYDSPSAAARAVKERRGLTGASASTNGREFWKLRHPDTNRLVPLSALRPVHEIDSEALLAELDRLASEKSVG